MNIFIHYLDKELLDLCVGRITEDVVKKVILSIKMAILLVEDNESIYIPASSYAESNFGNVVLKEFKDLIDFGIINYVSSSKNFESFMRKKKIVHPDVYTKREKELIEQGVPGVWQTRQRSATEDIRNGWKKNIDSHQWEFLYRACAYRKVSTFENAIGSIPDNLKERAFVPGYIIPMLKVEKGKERIVKEILNEEITRYYIESFLVEYNAVCYRDFFLLGSYVNELLPRSYNHISYSSLCKKLISIDYQKRTLYEYINDCDNYELLALKKQEIVKQLLAESKSREKNLYSKKKGRIKMQTFIVHGHDAHEKLSLKNYLQNTLKLEEPIVLAEKASSGKTIMEKFETYAEGSQLVFILLTPDDHYSDGKSGRARQNVIFEMGYFLGKLGRKSGRVILLYKGELELPNDISGIVYINIDNGIEAAGEQIRREIDAIS